MLKKSKKRNADAFTKILEAADEMQSLFQGCETSCKQNENISDLWFLSEKKSQDQIFQFSKFKKIRKLRNGGDVNE